MGHILKTPAGSYRANWRDAAGRQKAKTFRTKKEASAFLADVEASLNRGTYVDPHAGKTRFGEYAAKWLAARNDEKTTRARDTSIMRVHVIPQWGSVPLAKIDHLSVQAWVTELSRRYAPATVAECFRLTAAVMRTALRDRLIGFNPCDGVKVPRRRRKDTDDRIITPAELTGRLLPAVPERYRALVGLAGGTGLRWGECVGLRWDCVDWDGWDRPCRRHSKEFCPQCRDSSEVTVTVVRTAVEVAGHVTTKPFPKSRAGRRSAPVPGFAVQLLAAHLQAYPPGPAGEVFTNRAGGPLLRTHFRARVWRPALVRAGLLGRVEQLGEHKYRATWPDAAGVEWSAEFTTERDAVAHVVRQAANGLRFHDLRHSYATWLVSNGVPINDVQAVMGHEKASTTLDRYTHRSENRAGRLRGLFADEMLTPEAKDDPEQTEKNPGQTD